MERFWIDPIEAIKESGLFEEVEYEYGIDLNNPEIIQKMK